MSIQFRCESCGNPIEVGDHFEGKKGHCKHCGHRIVVPEHAAVASEGDGLRLKPTEDDGPAGLHDHLLKEQAPLYVRHAEAEPKLAPRAISDVDTAPLRPDENYKVNAPTAKVRHSSAGPPPFWINIPTLTARSLAQMLRTLRDWGYLVSLAGLVLALIGFTFKLKGALHTGVVVAIAANIEMLVVGTAYLVTLPFKESLHHGLANLFPPYAFYYWYSRWPKMKAPVKKTVGAFLPIALAGLGYFLYEDGAKVEAKGVEKLEDIEGKVEGAVNKVEGRAPALGKAIDGVLDQSDPGAAAPPKGEHAMTIDGLLKFAVSQDAADLHLQAGVPPRLRIKGQVREVDAPAADRRLGPRLHPRHRAPGHRRGHRRGDGPRLGLLVLGGRPGAVPRATCSARSGQPGMVLRVILPKIRTIDELHLPPVIREIAQARRGMALLSGATGSGKSTTLAAMVDLLNSDYYLKILTIEDPVEYEHREQEVADGARRGRPRHGVVRARPPPGDAAGARRDPGWRAARPRHGPDGPSRGRHRPPGPGDDPRRQRRADDRATARDDPRPPATDRARAARGVAGRRRSPSGSRTTRRASAGRSSRCLRGDSVVAKYIMENRINDIADYINTGQRGMQTFDKHLLDLYHQGILSGTQALAVATNPEALALEMRMPGRIVTSSVRRRRFCRRAAKPPIGRVLTSRPRPLEGFDLRSYFAYGLWFLERGRALQEETSAAEQRGDQAAAGPIAGIDRQPQVDGDAVGSYEV